MKNKTFVRKKAKVISLFGALSLTLSLLLVPLLVIGLLKNDLSLKKAQAAVSIPYGIAAGDVLPWLTDAQLNSYLDDNVALGSKWIRFDFSWTDIQAGGRTSYDWSRYDAIVNAANARGIKIVGVLAYTPDWARSSSCPNDDKCVPANVNDYATFAAAAAARYAPLGVHHWEIWNEQNITTFWKPQPNIAAYTALLKAAYPAIKNVDPQAVVLTGGTASVDTYNSNINAVEFLSGIYANGGQGYFDHVAHHPYCWAAGLGFNCYNNFANNNGWSQMQDTNPSLRSLMIANGDQNKQIWATEFGGPTGGTGSMTEAQQAQTVTDAYNLWNTYSWSGPLFWYQYKDSCTTATDVECFFGLLRANGTHKPSYDAYKTLATSVTPSTSVTSLTAQQGTPTTESRVDFTLQTIGSIPVENLIVAVRDQSDADFDFPVQTNVTLSGSQSFTASQVLPSGTYTYWVAYYANGVWTDLSPINTFTVAVNTPTPTPTQTPTPTPAPVTVTVTSLSVQGNSSRNPAVASYTLTTTGSLSVENLVVAVRKNGTGYDFPLQPATTLSGNNSFSVSKTFAKGTYTYWVAYKKNGVWVNLSPTKSFSITR